MPINWLVLRLPFLFSRERVKKAIIKRVVELGKKQGLEVFTGGIISRSNPDFWVYISEGKAVYCRIKDYVHPDDVRLFREGNFKRRLLFFAIKEARPDTKEAAAGLWVTIHPGSNPDQIFRVLTETVSIARQVESE